MRSSLTLLLALLVPAPAAAHPDVDAGVAAYESADFDAALAAFDQALDSELSREELVALFIGRSLVHYAKNDRPALDGDLTALLSLEPRPSFPEGVPPAFLARVRAAREGVAGRLSVRIQVEREATSARVTAEAEHDRAGLVESTLVTARAGEGDWVRGEREVRVDAPRGAPIEYWAELVGPAGAIVAHSGSEESPLLSSADGPVPMTPMQSEDDDDAPPWAWIAVGGAASVAATILVVVLATSGDPDTRLTGPALVEP